MHAAVSQVIDLHAAGCWTNEIVRRTGHCYRTIQRLLRENGLSPHDGRKLAYESVESPNAERNARMASMYKQGLTLTKIGDAFGISRERARRLIRNQGVSREDRGRPEKSQSRREARRAQREADCLARWGMSYAQHKAVAAALKRAFRQQRRSAAIRAIGWEFTLSEWLEVWTSSGKLEQRGVGRGRYCMARHGDVGPYRADNVSIQLNEVNSRDGIKKGAHKFMAANDWNIGSGRGWNYNPERSKSRPYQVRCARVYVGRFATQAEAEAAYRLAAIKYLSTKSLGV